MDSFSQQPKTEDFTTDIHVNEPLGDVELVAPSVSAANMTEGHGEIKHTPNEDFTPDHPEAKHNYSPLNTMEEKPTDIHPGDFTTEINIGENQVKIPGILDAPSEDNFSAEISMQQIQVPPEEDFTADVCIDEQLLKSQAVDKNPPPTAAPNLLPEPSSNLLPEPLPNLLPEPPLSLVPELPHAVMTETSLDTPHTKQVDMIECSLCHCRLESILCAKDHYEGRRHQKTFMAAIKARHDIYSNMAGSKKQMNFPKFKKAGVGGAAASTVSSNSTSGSVVTGDDGMVTYCFICNIQVNSNDQALQHYIGKKHRYKCSLMSTTPTPTGANEHNLKRKSQVPWSSEQQRADGEFEPPVVKKSGGPKAIPKSTQRQSGGPKAFPKSAQRQSGGPKAMPKHAHIQKQTVMLNPGAHKPKGKRPNRQKQILMPQSGEPKSIPWNTQRQIPTVTPQVAWPTSKPAPKQPSIHQTFTCNTCNVNVTSREMLDSHLAGSKHKKTLARLMGINPTEGGVENGRMANSSRIGNSGKVIQTPNHANKMNAPPAVQQPAVLCITCDVCSATTNSQKQYEQHLQSQRHRNMYAGGGGQQKRKGQGTYGGGGGQQRRKGQGTFGGGGGQQKWKSQGNFGGGGGQQKRKGHGNFGGGGETLSENDRKKQIYYRKFIKSKNNADTDQTDWPRGLTNHVQGNNQDWTNCGWPQSETGRTQGPVQTSSGPEYQRTDNLTHSYEPTHHDIPQGGGGGQKFSRTGFAGNTYEQPLEYTNYTEASYHVEFDET
ncbi:uncharacterized protein [Antedon mediterranea]|uniref:uncharacterized protein n=1 Tax=Antedon mediterranea TaxID=105859 RepID=UPI003AF7EF19